MKPSFVVVLTICVFAILGVGFGAYGAVATADDVRVYGGDSSPTDRMTSDSSEYFDESTQNFDSTTFEITVYENGSATWTFRHERFLSDETEVENFEAFAEEFESDETELYTTFENQAQALVEIGLDETDRDMEADNFDRNATVDHRLNPRGVVEMSFTWHRFAQVDDGVVTVGDVFGGGIFLADGQSMVVNPGDDLVFSSVYPEPEYTEPSIERADSVTWYGEYDFNPRLEFIVEGEEGAGEPDQSFENDESNTPVWLAVVGLLVVGLGIGSAFVWYRSSRFSERSTTDQSPSVRENISPSETVHVSEEELLSDEDRVIALIRENGGRMKQVKIVEETGWSKSKVSMLLSDMEEDDTISKLRVGRENIISLQGFEPEAAKSPFDEG